MTDDEMDVVDVLQGIGNTDLLDDERRPDRVEPRQDVPRPALGLAEEAAPPKIDFNVAGNKVLASLVVQPLSAMALKVRFSREFGSSKVVDDVLDWLRRRKRIAGSDKAWHLHKSAEQPKPVTTPAPLPPAPKPAAAAPPPEPRPTPRPATPPMPPTRSEKMSTQEWVSKAEAMKLLGLGESSVVKLATAGKIKARKDEEFAGAGRKPSVYLRSSLVAYQADFLSDGEKPKATPKKAAAPRKAAKKTLADVAKKHANGGGETAIDQVRWILRGPKVLGLTTDWVVEQLGAIFKEDPGAIEQLAEALNV